MEYSKTSKSDIFIRFNPETNQADVVDKKLLEQELAMIKQELAELPPEPDLIAWAKEHYEGKNFVMFEERKTDIETTLTAISKIK